MKPVRTTTRPPVARRAFLSACSAGAIGITQTSARAVATEATGISAIDFSRSYLYCEPKGSGIWVRPQIECRCVVFDKATGRSDEYVLSVVAKTGLKTIPATGVRIPGYDYWIIFSDRYVYTRRTHTSSYFNNPTTLRVEDFGLAKWHLRRAPATPLRNGAEIRAALKAWTPIVARSVFAVDDGSRGVAIEYPVKWADFNVKSDAFRVETGPVVLLDPERVRAGQPPKFEDFQWAHLDYHAFDRVLCMLDRPTHILTGATFTPPTEHAREQRRNPALRDQQVGQIRARLNDWPEAPIPEDAMRKLLQTDHYSEVIERNVSTELYALNES